MPAQTGMIPYALAAVAGAAGALSVLNPEGVDLIIDDAELDVTTKATAACTLAIGTAATAASSNNLFDAVDVGTAAGVFDLITNHGTAGKTKQLWLAGQFLTASQGTGAIAGLVATLNVHYHRRVA
jgi:hypothetical protein